MYAKIIQIGKERKNINVDQMKNRMFFFCNLVGIKNIRQNMCIRSMLLQT